jgi:hypothetical protein
VFERVGTPAAISQGPARRPRCKDAPAPQVVIAFGVAIPYNLSFCSALVCAEGIAPMSMTCPTCGNARLFLVKTAQMHVIEMKDARVDVSEESRPTVFEVLCDQCDAELSFDDLDDDTRREVLLALGAQ